MACDHLFFFFAILISESGLFVAIQPDLAEHLQLKSSFGSHVWVGKLARCMQNLSAVACLLKVVQHHNPLSDCCSIKEKTMLTFKFKVAGLERTEVQFSKNMLLIAIQSVF